MPGASGTGRALPNACLLGLALAASCCKKGADCTGISGFGIGPASLEALTLVRRTAQAPRAYGSYILRVGVWCKGKAHF